MNIQCCNPMAQYTRHRKDIKDAICRVLESGRYILGDEVRAFESEFAAYIGVRSAVGVGSGTEAIHLALRTCGIDVGDEVLTVSHTAVATVVGIELAGAIPVLIDIVPSTFSLDAALLEEALTSKTRAVVVVHLYGHPVDMDPVLAFAHRHGLRVIEDCAQAHGAKYKGRHVGSIGDVGCFSFYPTKNLGAIGDGGVVVMNDSDLFRKAILLREYGWAERYVSHMSGWNSRLDEIQAAILRVKLRTLDSDNDLRHKIAEVYHEALRELPLQLPLEVGHVRHAYHLYVVCCSRRDELRNYLSEKGIGTLVHYPVPVHLQPAYRATKTVPAGGLPETERVAGLILSLPIYPELPIQDVERVAKEIRAFWA